MKKDSVPYKIYLEESEMPRQWYNVCADMKTKHAPLLNSATRLPVTVDEMSQIFCTECAKQELDFSTAFVDIPDEVRDFYKMYRPSPLVRAYCLEKELDTPAKIYYKFEGNNTSGSHKLNSSATFSIARYVLPARKAYSPRPNPRTQSRLQRTKR